MFNLIKLEIKKFKLQGHVKSAFLVHLVLVALFCMLQVILQIENEPVDDIIAASVMLLEGLGRITFMMFVAVILANTVIEEYNKKTINLMFMYPISRKKLILAKLIIVVVFTFINILISNILLIATLYIANSFFDVLAWQLILSEVLGNIPVMIVSAMLSSFVALIPLHFGMKKKSTTVTMISGVLIVGLLNSGNGMMTLSSILPLVLIVAVVGILVVTSLLKRLDTEDVI
ncbi:MAG: ABC transporter permease [Sarcina sp.]